MNKEDDLKFRINKSGIAELDILGISSWEGFDQIIRFMEQIYSAEIKDLLDGIDTRSCIVIVNKTAFKLVHDDMFGNTMIAVDSVGNGLLKEIYEEMKERME